MIYVLNTNKQVVAVLSNDGGHACPYYNDLHVEKLVDFDSTYTFTSPANFDESEELIVGNYVAILDLDNDIQLFKITDVTDGFDSNGKSITVLAENAAIFDLNGVIIRPHSFNGMTAYDAFSYILQNSGWEVGKVDVIDTKDFSVDDYSTAQAVLHTIASTYNCDVKFHVELEGGRIAHQYIDLLQNRGTDNGKRFEYTKDILGIHRKTNITDNFATALIPLGATPEGSDSPITIASVNGGLDYIANDEANKRWNNGGRYIYKVYRNDKMETPQALLNDAKKQLEIVSMPQVTYEIDVLLLEQIAGYAYEHEKVRLGDTVKIVDLDMTPSLTVKSRVIEMDISYSDQTQSKCMLGDYVELQNITPNIISKIQDQVKKVLSSVDTSSYRVEIVSTNGNTFKNGQGTTDLIARVYNGKTPITSYIQKSDFIWYKINKDGTHDIEWEQAHVNVGNTVTVTADDVQGTATFQCDINQGTGDSILIANETDFTLLATLTNDYPDNSPNGTLAQSIWVDYKNKCIYWTYIYNGPKIGSYNKNQSYCILKTDMTGQTVIDQMWVIGGGHSSTIGFEVTDNGTYVYSNYMNADTNQYTLVRFLYVANKTLAWGDQSIQDLGVANNNDTRISIDQGNNMACIAIDSHMGNVDIYIVDLTDLKAGKLTVLYTMKASDYGFDNAKQQWQAHTFDFPYFYQSAGVWDFSQPKMMYCVDVRTKQIVYSINFKLNTIAIQPDGWDSEPEGMGFYYDENGKRHIQYCFGMGVGTNRISKIYDLVENERDA